MTTEEEVRAMEIANCPFCGKKITLDNNITSKSSFYEMQGEHGSACISLRCGKPCFIEMYEHTHDVHNYWQRVKMLITKWNMRKFYL